MDPATGLPMAFGKQAAAPVQTPSQTAGGSGSSERGGGGGGRGSRGVVGGGKRSRGRGGGRGGGDAGEGGGRGAGEGEGVVLNGGVKRPHPSSSAHSSLPPAPPSAYLPQAPSFGVEAILEADLSIRAASLMLPDKVGAALGTEEEAEGGGVGGMMVAEVAEVAEEEEEAVGEGLDTHHPRRDRALRTTGV
ncbi:uncharacterized protein MKK02DRAFT_43855 [Dioszegia hungarica]|uniref:Uncharacterized protein n=1 Tax=Dioszegia hungarica TaxID=4972 RepID=A0AA38H600_9TREE|nr:uncharacterized protein MKK02DRAFT_43855 [Dioszegia hungarica]KAI9635177.1 hypothetical protein MKK02DRAFT_43855 [Dioszegia hungarica]